MQTFIIKGVTNRGETIDVSVEANNEREALSTVNRIHGRLRKPFDIYTIKQLEELEYYSGNLLTPLSTQLSTNEILDIVRKIHKDEVTQEEYSLLTNHFMRMIRAAIREYWNDMVIETREAKELELLDDIILKFIPSYKETSKMGLNSYIKKKIRGRLIDDWKSEIYVNSRNGNIRLRSDDIQEYVRRTLIKDEEVDFEVRCEKIIEIGKLLDKEERPAKEVRDIFFEEIVALGLHKKFLKRVAQITTLELFYGESGLTGKEIALAQGIKQQSANENKLNAEKNIFRHIRKNFEVL